MDFQWKKPVPWVSINQSECCGQGIYGVAPVAGLEALLILLRKHIKNGGFVPFRHKSPSARWIGISENRDRTALGSDLQDDLALFHGVCVNDPLAADHNLVSHADLRVNS